jgi:hypothetical protein
VSFDDQAACCPITKKERPMSFDKTKLYSVGRTSWSGDTFATLDEAIAKAKQHSAKEFEDTAIWQAIQLVKAPIPGDIVVESLSTAS